MRGRYTLTSAPKKKLAPSLTVPHKERRYCTARSPILNAGCSRHKMPATIPSLLRKLRTWLSVWANRCCFFKAGTGKLAGNSGIKEERPGCLLRGSPGPRDLQTFRSYLTGGALEGKVRCH